MVDAKGAEILICKSFGEILLKREVNTKYNVEVLLLMLKISNSAHLPENRSHALKRKTAQRKDRKQTTDLCLVWLSMPCPMSIINHFGIAKIQQCIFSTET